MKKIKKLLAMLMAMTMVLGMSTTVFAEGKSATITVNGVEGSAKYTYAQIIKPNPNKKTGWEFVNDTYKGCFTTEFENSDDQAIIEQMINAKKGIATGNDDYTANYAAALSAVFNAVSGDGELANTKTVNEAGVYFIKIVDTEVDESKKVTYSPVTAYISFDTYVRGVPTTLKSDTVTAKKDKIKVDKESSDENKDEVVAIGDTVTFTITTTVPYIAGPNDRTYYIFDKISGAEYFELDKATITHAGSSYSATVVQGEGNASDTFSINLSDLITPDNSNAGNSIVVTYQAKITGPIINNKAAAGHQSDTAENGTFGTGEDDVYTGTIDILKYDADTGEAKTPLSGATFEVKKDNTGDALKFKEETTGTKGVYVYAPDSVADDATEVVTDANGKLILKGLDAGSYTLTETEAPEGYSLANPKTVTLEVVTSSEDPNKPVTGTDETIDGEAVKVANKTIIVTDEIGDTRLSSLPSTGGIGTTIFTIGGCALMIIAAGLYFATRRKNAK